MSGDLSGSHDPAAQACHAAEAGAVEQAPTVEPPPRRHGMVEWFSPIQLLSTGFNFLISEALGTRIDYRLMEDEATQPVFDYTRTDTGAPRRDFWLDFLADTGDGWNPTHAIASLLAQPELRVHVPRTAGRPLERPLRRADVVVLGGDEVYPDASQRNYRERFVGPFKAALPWTPWPNPHMFAIPGNHDWYDNLVSFSRLFTQGRWIGGWRTQQRRSYFALRLPHRWWLWAVDVHLESDIDAGQLAYFCGTVAPELERGDRIILVSAEPDWLYRDIRDKTDSSLRYLEERVIEPTKARVYLWLAGDLHHYRRHEKRGDPNLQRITSGGGGAFLAPTHGPVLGAMNPVSRRLVKVGEDEFQPRRSFPSPSTSFRLSLLNLLFLLKNWKLGFLTGLFYAVLTWQPPTPELSLGQDVIAHPLRLSWMLVVVMTCVFFADRERRVFRWLAGTLHGAAHVAAALWIAAWTAERFDPGVWGEAARIGANFLGGALAGPVIWGLYLLLALNLFGAHATEAFSALRIEDYKHFLRLHITERGDLEIFPIGITRVPRAGGARADYTLIEGPVVIRPGASTPPGP